MKIVFRTNLDLHQADIAEMRKLSDEWTRRANSGQQVLIPRKEETVLLASEHPVRLRVCGVLYTLQEIIIELHIEQLESLRTFYGWYAPRWGQTAASYI